MSAFYPLIRRNTQRMRIVNILDRCCECNVANWQDFFALDKFSYLGYSSDVTKVGEHSMAYGRKVFGKSVRTNLLKRSFGCIFFPPSLPYVELNFPYPEVQISIPLTNKFSVFQSKF